MSSQSPQTRTAPPFNGVVTEQCQLLLSGIAVLILLEVASAITLVWAYWDTPVSRQNLLTWLGILATVQTAKMIALPLCHRRLRNDLATPHCRHILSVIALSTPLILGAAGYLFNPSKKQAVVGSFAAERLKLKVGDTFHPYHGLIFEKNKQHAETYVVSGVMEPSNTPADRVIWIPIAGLQNMAGHNAETASDVSAVLVKLRGKSSGMMMNQEFNLQGDVMTFAWPIADTMSKLFNKIAPVEMVLRAVAFLVALVAAGSILASIYNSMNERRREIAILRALGARRSTIFAVVVLEASGIAALGAVAGFGVYFVIMSIAAWFIRQETGIVLNPLELQSVMAWVPLAMLGLGALAGLVPAAKAYRTDVAENLTPIS